METQHRSSWRESTWSGWRRCSRAPAAHMSEGTVWLCTPGVVFAIWMHKKAFIPKFAVWKSPQGKKQNTCNQDL